MRYSSLILPMALSLLWSTHASAQEVQKFTLPPANDGKPVRILESVEVPAAASTLYLSGQVASPKVPGMRPTSLADFGNTAEQTRNILQKISATLAKRGYSMKDLVKVTIFLKSDPDLGKMDFSGANAAFDEFFNSATNPTTVARTTVEVSGFAGPYYLVEVDVIAAKMR